MADQEDEDLKMALRMSLQSDSPEPKRSKPGENAVGGEEEESSEVRNRRKQRELMAAAAEKRMMAAAKHAADAAAATVVGTVEMRGAIAAKQEKPGGSSAGIDKALNLVKREDKNVNLGKELSVAEAGQLFSLIFGSEVTKEVLRQWSNQGIRFSCDPETSMGLVQHEGGPCGVLAAIQAFVLKYLLFSMEELNTAMSSISTNTGLRGFSKHEYVGADNFSSLTEDKKSIALVRSMAEILFSCGTNGRAVIASLRILDGDLEGSVDSSRDEVIAKALDGLTIESGLDFHNVLSVNEYTSPASALERIEAMLPVYRSRMGAMLFLISALLSRGMDSVQADRDDPSQPLVTAPFGHASQEIVNLLLCGRAVANVFDGMMDLGGGMFVKGISTTVEVGFLTLLESLNYCKVGQYLKCPRWPIWVVGSESHYTVLFALDTKVQEENELEGRESQIRRAFDVHDQSGGGGFIGVEGFHQVLRDTNIILPAEKLEQLCNTGFIVWSEFWQILLDLDKNLGGLKDSSGLSGKKVFDLYHFNGIAKSVMNGNQPSSGREIPLQRPRLTKLRVSVPPRWTPEEFMSDVPAKIDPGAKDTVTEVSKPEPSQHAPLVDCIRTRWARATCSWEGDAPSIV
ncbi:PREDICTED: ubiquitin carboxyl-terminal hydrolase FAM188A [Ipomoea nil]|uniref:ubiquitin carboxyl-terminal hydrolase FAM188A n=1 Tax=Ipomoea nil TaxID=35883 RepID=UPI000900E1B2|nr:PREDICTED: ubiquitin carboxyl-terminal hydrolase FAM188A [Ipomoea nil]XP_019190407.1 PREDICTED: ubiquitin carboxyl-terminal hydrolase FAM188A [Ipomoea nil]